MLKKKIRALDEVDAQFRTEYEKRADGFFHLKVEPDDGDGEGDDEPPSKDSAKVAELRRRNIQIQKELAELKSKFEGIDMDAYQNAVKYAEQAQSEQERALLKAGRFDDVLSARMSKTKDAFEKELAKEKTRAAELEKSAAKFKAELRGDRVRAKLRAVADEMKLKLVPSGVPDFYRRGLEAFTDLDENGELVAFDGEDVRLNAERKPYSAKDFVMDVVETAPHLVEGASGADLGGGTRKGRRSASGVVEIDRSDKRAIRDNIENIAKGKVIVRAP